MPPLAVALLLAACGPALAADAALAVDSSGDTDAISMIQQAVRLSSRRAAALEGADVGRASISAAGAVSRVVQRRSRSQVALRFVPNPKPVSTEEMRSVSVDGMKRVTLSGSSDVIYTYPVEEDMFVSGSIEETGGWETNLKDEVCGEFAKIDKSVQATFLDVGANIGTYSVPMARCLLEQGRTGRVVSVEGVPSIADHLEASVYQSGLHDQIDIYDYAVSDGNMTDDTVDMNLAPSNKGGSSVLGNKPKGLVEGGEVQDGDVVVAKVTTLDSILRRNPKMRNVLVMKMDIEGSEGHALNGAKKLLADYPPCVIELELNPDWLERAGTPIESVLDTLRGAGFDVPEDQPVDAVQTPIFRQRDFDACVARLS